MAVGDELFLTIIDRLAQGGVITDIVLIGSWVLPIYRAYFNDAPEIPILRTTDVDFLVGMPPKVQRHGGALSGLRDPGARTGSFCIVKTTCYPEAQGSQ